MVGGFFILIEPHRHSTELMIISIQIVYFLVTSIPLSFKFLYVLLHDQHCKLQSASLRLEALLSGHSPLPAT